MHIRGTYSKESIDPCEQGVCWWKRDLTKSLKGLQGLHAWLTRLTASPRMPENAWIIFTAGRRQLIRLRFLSRYSLNALSRSWSSSRTAPGEVKCSMGAAKEFLERSIPVTLV